MFAELFLYSHSNILSKYMFLSARYLSRSFSFSKNPLKFYSTMNLNQVVKRLTEYANLNLACDWDNVGLLVEPSGPIVVEKILVTNDLTESVLDEAIQQKINLIVTYHPAIFYPLKRLTQKEWKQRSIVKCIENKIAVYSPHTSWDSVNGGINDWLINQFGPKCVEPVETLISSSHPSGFSKTVKVCLNEKSKESFLETIKKANNIMRLDNNTDDLEFLTSPAGVVEIIENIKNIDSLALNTLRIHDLAKPILKNCGLGRIGVLDEPKTLRDVVETVKRITNLKHVRLAIGNGKTLDDMVKSIAVGAGSGSKLLNNANVDLILTGEFAHHEILHETHRGVHVILTDHSNNERCYFEHFKKSFTELLNKYNEKIEIEISKEDRDPLSVI